MPEFIAYLLKANLGIVLFYLAYKFFLRKLTFHNVNRFFLLFGILFSISYPLLENVRNWLIPKDSQTAEWIRFVPDWQELDEKATDLFTAWDLALLCFWSIAIFFLLRFLIGLYGIYRIHRKSIPGSFLTFRFRQVFMNINPFSFWKTVYLNSIKHDQIELQNVLSHEKVHVKQLHTLDTLIGESISIFFWFNPACWLYKTAIQENLEFLTDQEVLRIGTNKKKYQYSLLQVLSCDNKHALASNFNLKSVKQRIYMMNAKRSNKISLGKYIILTPVIALFILGFTMNQAYQHSTDTAPVVLVNHSKDDTIGKKNSLSRTNGNNSAIQINAKKEPYVVVNGIPKGKDKKHLNELNPSDIDSITVLKGDTAEALYGLNGKDGAVLVATKNADKTENKVSKIRIRNSSEVAEKPPIVYLDGKEISEQEMDQLNPEDIERIDVLKGAKAIAEGGTKGENGIIYITTKTN